MANATFDLGLREAVGDFRWVELPWILPGYDKPWEFEIARDGYKPFKQWGEEQRKRNPYFRALAKVSQASLVLSPDSKVSERLQAKMIEEMDPEQLEKLNALAKEGMAKVRIRACRGVTNAAGVEYEYSHELGLHLLSLENPVEEWIDRDEYFDADGNAKKDEEGVPKKMPTPNMIPLGDAILRYLVAQAGKLEKYRTDIMEAARKN